jgi:hypothetical protein
MRKYRVDQVRAVGSGERKVKTAKFADLAAARAYFSACEMTTEIRYIRLCRLVPTPLSLNAARSWRRIDLRRGPAYRSQVRQQRGREPESQMLSAAGL